MPSTPPKWRYWEQFRFLIAGAQVPTRASPACRLRMNVLPGSSVPAASISTAGDTWSRSMSLPMSVTANAVFEPASCRERTTDDVIPKLRCTPSRSGFVTGR